MKYIYTTRCPPQKKKKKKKVFIVTHLKQEDVWILQW
jgi:hypothetical protein